MNIFPVFRFYVNGKMIHQCYGGIELSFKTNLKNAIKKYDRIINPPKKKVQSRI